MAKKKSKKKKNIISDLRDNPWILSTVILAIVCILLIVLNPASVGLSSKSSDSSQSGEIISKEKAGQKILDFASQQGANPELVGVEEESGLYKVTLSVQGKEAPVYITKDGENLARGVMSFEEIIKRRKMAQQAAAQKQAQQINTSQQNTTK